MHHVCLLRFSTLLGQTIMPMAFDAQDTQITTVIYFLLTVHPKGRRRAANARFKYVQFHQQEFNIKVKEVKATLVQALRAPLYRH